MLYRAGLALVLVLILSACGGVPAAVEVPIPTPPPPTTPSPIPPTPTPALIWKPKLNGLWEQQTATGTAEWLIDLDGGKLISRTYDGDVPIEFEREEGQTVYILLRGRAGDRRDSFRFVGDDVVIWTQGYDGENRTTTLERSR